ncbi:MAG: hypothetical protein IT337_01425 [Thermomicrobiales bacterium]|nr:hypothetical protein [Thermomicrobiales bacterium]
MDPRRFEEVTRGVGKAATRREAFAALAGGIAAAFGVTRAVAAEEDGARSGGVPLFHCRIPGQYCKRNKQCCSNRCSKGVCTCAAKGRRCMALMEGALCCSGRCKNGRCR